MHTRATDVLSVEDRKLPQIQNLLPMLQRGFGVHHSGEASGHLCVSELVDKVAVPLLLAPLIWDPVSPPGLLPILKELVEILFQEGLLKVSDSSCPHV